MCVDGLFDVEVDFSYENTTGQFEITDQDGNSLGGQGAVPDLSSEPELRVWPNPFSDILEIDLGEELQAEARLYLTDLNGIRHAELHLPSLEERQAKGEKEVFITSPDLPAGVYILSCVGADGRVRYARVLKQ